MTRFRIGQRKKKNFLGINKDRPDVSFLQEKAPMLYSINASKPIALEANQGVLLSQSQLTSGNEARDDFL